MSDLPKKPDGIYGVIHAGLSETAIDLRDLRARIEELRRDLDRQCDELWVRLNGNASALGVIREVDDLKRQMGFVLKVIQDSTERRERDKEKRTEREETAKRESRRNLIALVMGLLGFLVGVGNLVARYW